MEIAACDGADLGSLRHGTRTSRHVASLMGDIPHVVSAHWPEPLVPVEGGTVGGGYRLSSYVEKTACEAVDAIVAVS